MTWDEFCNGLKKTAGIAADKINRTTDLAALQVKLNMAQRKLNEAYAALGRLSYGYFRSEDEEVADEISAACEAIDQARNACDKLKEQLEAQQAAEGIKKE